VPQLQQGECIEAMQQLQQEGKIRYWGLSLNTFYPDAEGDYLLENGAGNGFQVVLNILNQKGLGLIKKAAAKGYGIIARMPLQFGLLTGKFNEQKTFEANDHRSKRLTKDVIQNSLTALEPVWALCEKYKITKTALALSYILSYDEVSTVIPGIRTPEQVESNTTGIVKLDEEDKQFIESLNQKSFESLLKLIESKG
jgi:aryl-alcohol dehydrogenase-like predicted oxidoreductase